MPDSGGSNCPTTGATVTLTDYIQRLLDDGRLLQVDPLATGGDAIDVTIGNATSTSAAQYGSLSGTAFPVTVNAAQAAVSAAGGGTVVVPRGAYTVLGTTGYRLNGYSNVKLVFEPGCTISTGALTGTTYVFHYPASSASLTNYVVEGNGLVVTMSRAEAQTCYGISIGATSVSYSITNVTFRDITLANARTDGLQVGANTGTTMSGLRFERIVCTNCYRNGGSFTTGDDVTFIDCTFTGTNGESPQAGFDVEANQGTSTSRARFIRCSFTSNTGNGLYIQTPSYAYSARHEVRDCYAASNTGYGFAVIGRQTTVSGCVARQNTSSGFYLTDDVSVTNCLSIDNASSGYQAIAGGGTLVIYGCHAITNAGSGYTANTPTNAHGRIQIHNSASTGNTLRGFALTNAHQVLISGCSAIANQQEGIQVTSGSHHNAIDGCYVAANGQVNDNAGSNILIETGCNNNSVTRCVARQGANFYRGSVDTGSVTPTTTSFALSSDAATNDDVYTGCYLRIISGTQSGQVGLVTDYVASTKTITLGAAIAGAPDATSVVTIVGTQLYQGTIVSGSSTSVVLPTQMSSSRDDVYNNAILYVTSGTGSGQYRTISDYTGSSRTLTLSSALTTALDTTSNVAIVPIRRPSYGLRVDSGALRAYATGNDLYYGGATGGYSSAEATTDTSSANRTS